LGEEENFSRSKLSKRRYLASLFFSACVINWVDAKPFRHATAAKTAQLRPQRLLRRWSGFAPAQFIR
jgi:hypothetical protein